MVQGFRKKDLRLKIIWCPPPLWYSPVLNSVNLTRTFISQEEFWNDWGVTEVSWTWQSLTSFFLGVWSHDFVLCWGFSFRNPFLLFAIFVFPKFFLDKFFRIWLWSPTRCPDSCLSDLFSSSDLAGLFVSFFSIFNHSFFWTRHVTSSRFWLRWKDYDCLSHWLMRITIVVSASVDLLTCDRYPLGYCSLWCTLLIDEG